LDAERDNLRAVMQQVLDGGDTRTGLRLAGALTLWFWRGPTEEGRRWLEVLLALPDAQTPTLELAQALLACCFCAWGQHDFSGLHRYSAAMVGLCRTLGEKRWLARALTSLEHLGSYIGPDVM